MFHFFRSGGSYKIRNPEQEDDHKDSQNLYLRDVARCGDNFRESIAPAHEAKSHEGL